MFAVRFLNLKLRKQLVKTDYFYTSVKNSTSSNRARVPLSSAASSHFHFSDELRLELEERRRETDLYKYNNQ